MVRLSSFTPREDSSRWISVVAVAFGICRLWAARAMPPVSTTRTKKSAAETVAAAAVLAFDGDQQMAVLLSQRMLGRKKWVEK